MFRKVALNSCGEDKDDLLIGKNNKVKIKLFLNILISVLAMIEAEGPFTAYGYFVVNNSSFMSIISQTIGYLIIMITLK